MTWSSDTNPTAPTNFELPSCSSDDAFSLHGGISEENALEGNELLEDNLFFDDITEEDRETDGGDEDDEEGGRRGWKESRGAASRQ